VEVQPAPGAPSRAIAVTLPVEIDVANADRIGEELYSACGTGAPVVVADMAATTFCDSTGLRALAAVHKRAAASGTELRLAVPCAALRRTFAARGLAIPIFPRLDAALRLEPWAGTYRWWPGLTME